MTGRTRHVVREGTKPLPGSQERIIRSKLSKKHWGKLARLFKRLREVQGKQEALEIGKIAIFKRYSVFGMLRFPPTTPVERPAWSI